MNFFFKILLTTASLSLVSNANATFSMIALDTKTNEFGSVLVSCVNNDAFLSNEYRNSLIDKYLIAYSPRIGIMNLQALPLAGNFRRAARLMGNGKNAYEVIQKLIKHEKDGLIDESNKRQYLALTRDVNSKQVFNAFYTGENIKNYIVDNYSTFSGGITSETSSGRFVYAIAGNHLTGESVLTKMDSGFKETNGNLTEKLIGALQSVRNEKNIGDFRCSKNMTTSNFGFLKIFKDEDILKDYSIYTIQSENKDAIDGLSAELNSLNN
ncbi:DUF1028 domain-containing protein [Silvanigrella sp.]|jgi:hypothetical protein|uniref:DUF1028 domain-containing protein n=1 Tax=Silvanigrella sp. TaxID=2024976 RepID=UPI0037CB4690